MNMKLFLVFGGLSLSALAGCVVVGSGNTGGSGGGTGGEGGTTSVGVTTTGTGGTGGQGGAGGAAACDAALGCGDAITANANNLPPCDMTSAGVLTEYMKCACAQPNCIKGGSDQLALCDAMPQYDAAAAGMCQMEIQTNCATQFGACSGDIK
jgi:hypothetical protein